MMIKPVWAEYRDQWPPAYWDDWLRHPDRRHDRACIRPEVSRTYTFGEQGTSQAQYVFFPLLLLLLLMVMHITF